MRNARTWKARVATPTRMTEIPARKPRMSGLTRSSRAPRIDDREDERAQAARQGDPGHDLARQPQAHGRHEERQDDPLDERGRRGPPLPERLELQAVEGHEVAWPRDVRRTRHAQSTLETRSMTRFQVRSRADVGTVAGDGHRDERFEDLRLHQRRDRVVLEQQVQLVVAEQAEVVQVAAADEHAVIDAQAPWRGPSAGAAGSRRPRP